MEAEFYGSLVVRLLFTKHVDGKRFFTGTSRLVAFHGTLPETKAEYKTWLEHNQQLQGQTQGTFEVRMAVHVSDL